MRTRRCQSLEAGSLATVTAWLVVAVGPEVVTGSGWDIVDKRIEGFLERGKAQRNAEHATRKNESTWHKSLDGPALNSHSGRVA